MSKFDDMVFFHVAKQRQGSRFPDPIELMRYGRLTEAYRDLMSICEEGPETIDGMYVLVCGAIKRLQEAGKVVLVFRWGYTWVAVKGRDSYHKGEVQETPGPDCPLDWREL